MNTSLTYIDLTSTRYNIHVADAFSSVLLEPDRKNHTLKTLKFSGNLYVTEEQRTKVESFVKACEVQDPPINVLGPHVSS